MQFCYPKKYDCDMDLSLFCDPEGTAWCLGLVSMCFSMGAPGRLAKTYTTRKRGYDMAVVTMKDLMLAKLDEMEAVHEGYPEGSTYGFCLMDRWGLTEDDIRDDIEWSIYGRGNDLPRILGAARPGFGDHIEDLRAILKSPDRHLVYRKPENGGDPHPIFAEDRARERTRGRTYVENGCVIAPD
jgi:hypothetical protein